MASELVPGGGVGWRTVKVDPAHQGAVRISFPEVNWQGLMQAMSQRAVLEVQAWAIGSLAVAVDGHYRLDCKGVHKVHLVSVAHVSRPPRSSLRTSTAALPTAGAASASAGSARAPISCSCVCAPWRRRRPAAPYGQHPPSSP